MSTYQVEGEPDEEQVFLEGHLTAGAAAPRGGCLPGAPGVAFNTLDEPIKETILRDVRAVGIKFKHVLYPIEKRSLLKDWDLWGPLILCTFMATVLQSHTGEPPSAVDRWGGAEGPEFAEVFVMVWLGAMVVTLNTKLLGGRISFFQSVCVLGYCLLPLSMALALCRIVLVTANGASSALFAIRCASTLFGFVWAVYGAMKFLGDSQPAKRKALAAYPIGLFYFVIAWLVISHN